MRTCNRRRLKELEQRALSGQMTSEDFRLPRTLINVHKDVVNLVEDPATSTEDVFAYFSRLEKRKDAQDLSDPDDGNSLAEPPDHWRTFDRQPRE